MVTNGNRIKSKQKRSHIEPKVNTILKTSGVLTPSMRRSVTIEPDLHDYIIQLRGWLGMEKRIDADYTTVLNALARLGAIRIHEWDDLKDEEKEAVTNTLQSDPEKQLEAAADEWWTKHLKVQLPSYDPEPIQEESEEIESNSNSVIGKKKDATPEKE